MGNVGFEEIIDKYAGDRHIKPDGVGPCGNFPVFLKAFSGSKEESCKDEGDDYDAGNDVGDQNEEIDWANETLAREFGISVVVMIEEVADEEEGGTEGCQYHAGDVSFGLLTLNADDSDGDQTGTESVEAGIHKREAFNEIVVGVPRGLAKIYVPDKEQHNHCAEA